MKVYEYCLVLHPTQDEKKKGKHSTILAGPSAIMAKDDAMATMMAARQIPEEHADHLDRIEVAVRPF